SAIVAWPASHLIASGYIILRSESLSLARPARSFAIFVDRPCRQLPLFAPDGAPVLLPPWSWQRRFDLNAGLRQGVPDRVFAPHLSPGQLSPKRHALNLGCISLAFTGLSIIHLIMEIESREKHCSDPVMSCLRQNVRGTSGLAS